jgi:sulfatase maturation enzyme AslB (radical SAM superfamily)
MRNYRGSDYNSGYPDCELSLSDIQKIFSPEFLSQLDVVNFNGNLGDFALSRWGLEIVQYITGHDVQVKINTNGSARSANWWSRLAHPLVTIGFAIDGLADTHSLYRQDTEWSRVIDNATAYIQAGGRAVWRFVPFDHNRHQESQCREMAKDLGFLQFENIYDGRDRGPVFDRDGTFSHWIGPKDDHTPNVQDLLQGHVTWYNKNAKFDKDQTNLSFDCLHKRDREIYLAADGTVYPCCYLGFYPKTMAHPGNQELAAMVHENNALQYPLEHCLQWFDSVEQAWAHASIAEGRPYQCVNSCGR